MTMRVLIVDDSRLARMAVIKNLGKLRPDWVYAEASNPDEALEVMKKTPAGLAIVDFNMPGRDGLALASELLELNLKCRSHSCRQTPGRDLERTAQLGATFLSKPLNEAAFGAFLDTAASR